MSERIRDVKPSQIKLKRPESHITVTLTVMDFGLATLLNSPKAQDQQNAVQQKDESPPAALTSTPSTSQSQQGVFPWWWVLFPFILPRSVRERVYEPAFEELKEDYLKALPLWTGWLSRRWLTFCFSVRTAGLFGGSIWAAMWDAIGSRARKLIFGFIATVVGAQNADAIRQKLCEWFGRLL
jgi:hypothetical protein